MKKLYLLLLVLPFAFSGMSQTFEWLKTVEIDYEYNPEMIQYSTCTDSDGNIYFFGLQELVLFYNEAMGSQFLKKYNPQGGLEWEKLITGEGLAAGLYCDHSGGVYLYGQMHSNLDFWGELTLDFAGVSTNGFIVKIDYDGEINWGLNLEDLPMESGTVSDMTSDDSGLLYVAYSTWINSYIVMIGSNGNYSGAIIQEDVSIVSGVDVDDDGNIYAAGGCAGFYSTFGGVSYPAPFPYSMYIVRYNSGLEPVWVKFIEDITCSQLRIKCDNLGNVFVVGQIFAETALDTIIIQGAEWVYDFFLTRLNAEGEYEWVLECPQVLTGDATVGKLQYLNTDSEGNALLAGFTRGIIDWGNGNISNSGDLYYSIIIWNVSPQGIVNWLKTGGGDGFDNSHSLATNTSGDIFLAGIAGGTATFDTINYITDDFVYPFLAKLDMPAVTNVNGREEQQLLIVYPNPATDRILIRAEGAESYSIFNSFGEKVKIGLITGISHQIEVDDLAPGIYFIHVKNELPHNTRASVFTIK